MGGFGTAKNAYFPEGPKANRGNNLHRFTYLSLVDEHLQDNLATAPPATR